MTDTKGLTMRIHDFYMHKNALDVCVQILDIRNDKVLVQWVNLGAQGKPFLVPTVAQEIEIKDSKDWIDVTEKIYSVRTESGLPK